MLLCYTHRMKDIYDQTHFSITHKSKIIDFTIDTLPSDAPLDKAFAILTVRMTEHSDTKRGKHSDTFRGVFSVN